MQEALIVDDSKTARAILRNKLIKQKIAVAMVESGEEALLYLRDNHPDMIFMDHMMPGMDGFDAVKAIKSNPKDSSIPIVMHTTKQGDIYIGQAKALGAADILPKSGTDQDLLKVLDRLQAAAKDLENNQPRVEIVSLVQNDDQRVEDKFNAVESNGEADLKRENNEELDRASRLGSSSSNGSASISAPYQSEEGDENTDVPFLGTFRQWLIAIIWLFPIVWLLWLYLPAQEQLRANVIEKQELYRTIQWALNKDTSYDYGETPNSGARLALLQDLVPQLAAANFQGVIQMEGHVGAFCLSQVLLDDGSQINMLPEYDFPVSECTSIGSSVRQALQLSIEESPEFNRFLEAATTLYPDIGIEIIPLGASRPAYSYPADLDGVTAGVWNEIALANNRVHFTLLPAATIF